MEGAEVDAGVPSTQLAGRVVITACTENGRTLDISALGTDTVPYELIARALGLDHLEALSREFVAAGSLAGIGFAHSIQPEPISLAAVA